MLAGAGGWSRDLDDARKGFVRHVATAPAFLRRGIAGRLISHRRDQAEASGAREMKCWSTRGTIGFYMSLGFVAEGGPDVMLRGRTTLSSIRTRRSLQVVVR